MTDDDPNDETPTEAWSLSEKLSRTLEELDGFAVRGEFVALAARARDLAKHLNAALIVITHMASQKSTPTSSVERIAKDAIALAREVIAERKKP